MGIIRFEAWNWQFEVSEFEISEFEIYQQNDKPLRNTQIIVAVEDDETTGGGVGLMLLRRSSVIAPATYTH